MLPNNGTYQVGISTTDITPPVGIYLAGFAARQDPSTEVYHPLRATAVAIHDGSTPLIIVGAEILGFYERTDAVRARIREATGIDPAHILLNGSHTHCGPCIREMDRARHGELDEGYIETLMNNIARVEMCSERLFNLQFDLESDAYDETRSDVSSPDGMVKLLELLYAGDILSPESRESALDILKRQQLKTVIPHALPAGTTVAHKTGSYMGVRADVGIVFSPSGPYTVAIMAKGVTEKDRMRLDLGLAAVSRAVYDALVA